MSSDNLSANNGINEDSGPEPEVIVAELVPGPPAQELPVARIVRRRLRLPLLLFIATCLSTLLAGGGLIEGWKYALPLMTILICHEAGHFLQARRYRVYASYPYFIPMPAGPLGTFGAVIAMEARMGHRRALFDIGITGPLAGLVPTLVFCVVGLHLSTSKPWTPTGHELRLGEPLLFELLREHICDPTPPGHELFLHPMAYAGWVGLLITALNLVPIGQLDGGHVLYALLRTKAHRVASLLLLAAVVAVVSYGLIVWTLMLFLLMLMGPNHPPTADDEVPLGAGRIVLGWLTLAFIPFGFTGKPFDFGA